MAIVIRLARADELDAVARLWFESAQSMGLGPGGATLDELCVRVPREMAAGWSLYVAQADGTLAAMLAIRLPDHLDQIFVAPAFQGQGVGKTLLEFARSQMPDELWLRTTLRNERAWRWYEREGFVRERLEQAEPLPRVYYRWKRGAPGGPAGSG